MADTLLRRPIWALLVSAIAAACGGSGDGSGGGDVTGPPGGAGTVDSLVLSVDSTDVIVGDTVRIAAEARDANGQVVPGVRLGYTSSNPAVASVTDDGLVTALDFGSAEIEVGIVEGAGLRAAPLAASYAAVMTKPGSRAVVRGVPRVVITPGEQTLETGVTSRYSATATNVRGQGFGNVSVRWSSSDPSVAEVDGTGLATTHTEGETTITVTVTAGPLLVSASVPLHVGVCGGIAQVAGWDVTADVEYKVNGTGTSGGFDVTYRISHVSTGKARLTKQPSSADGSWFWAGPVTGTVTIDDSETTAYPDGTGVRTEKKSGAIQQGPAAFMGLWVIRRDSTCYYTVQYGDWLSWTLENDMGTPPVPVSGPPNVAVDVGELGPRPAGIWLITQFSAPLPAVVVPEFDPNGVPASAQYLPGTILGIRAIDVLGGGSGAYGQAGFAYVLQSR